MSSPSNVRRAAWAAAALHAFRNQVGCDDDDTLILDLIVDLGHLAKAHKLDFVTITGQAVSHWAYECRYPDGTGANPQVSITIGNRKPKLAWPAKVIGDS